MPSTPHYALPYPLGTDPADGPLGFGNLANRTELIIDTMVVPPLTARLATLEATLLGVSNNGAGTLNYPGYSVQNGVVTGILQVGSLTGSAAQRSMIRSLDIGQQGANSSPDGMLRVWNDLTVFGGSTSTFAFYARQGAIGFFGRDNSQYPGSGLASAVSSTSGATQTGLNEILKCLRGYGLMS